MTVLSQPALPGLSRTEAALAAWAAALPAAAYLIALVPADGVGGLRPERRRWTREQLLEAAGWLRQRNAAGCHTYGRPDDPRHLLLDDLTAEGLDALRAAHRVAAIVRTSPLSFQAWITVSEGPVPRPIATAAARLLAARHGGDRGAADSAHLGRLPGLCNRKPSRRRADGGHPWVHLLWAQAGVDPGGAALLAEAVARSTAPLRARPGGGREAAVPLSPPARPPRWRPLWRLPADEHARGEAALRAVLPNGTLLDRSRLDWAVARRLLRQGAPEAFVGAVVESGAKAAGLRPAQRGAYAARTVAAAREALRAEAGEAQGSDESDDVPPEAEEGGGPGEPR